MRYLIGIDGGGTATKVCIADMTGAVRARHSAGALNINGQSQEGFRRTMEEVLGFPAKMGLSAEACAGVGVGAAGTSNPVTQTMIQEAVKAAGFTAPVRVYGDDETALAAAFPECHGIILIAGTGSVCCGRRPDGSRIRVGGCGHLIDDGGSAYDIARRMLAAIVKAEDGRAEPTALRELVFGRLDISSVKELVGYLYAPERKKGDVASLAVLLEQAVAAGDAAALEAERASADELCELIRPVLEKMPEEKNVALAGSVLLKNRRIQQYVRDQILRLRDDAWILTTGRDASEGAVRLLMKELSGEKADF